MEGLVCPACCLRVACVPLLNGGQQKLFVLSVARKKGAASANQRTGDVSVFRAVSVSSVSHRLPFPFFPFFLSLLLYCPLPSSSHPYSSVFSRFPKNTLCTSFLKGGCASRREGGEPTEWAGFLSSAWSAPACLLLLLPGVSVTQKGDNTTVRTFFLFSLDEQTSDEDDERKGEREGGHGWRDEARGGALFLEAKATNSVGAGGWGLRCLPGHRGATSAWRRDH